MSYREENGSVILSMSREDYDELMYELRSQAGQYHREGLIRQKIESLLNRLNSGNPNYTPYSTKQDYCNECHRKNRERP